MSTVHNVPKAPRGAGLRIAGATLFFAAGMYAVIGHFAHGLDAARVEQIRVGNVDRKVTATLDALDCARLGENEIPSPADRDAAAADMKRLVREEGTAATVRLQEAFDLCLAGIDEMTADLHRGDGKAAMTVSYETRPAYLRLRAELAKLDEACEARSGAAALATGLSSLAALLLSAAFVSYFATRHGRRAAALTALEILNHSAEARERRVRLLLDVEEATRDLAESERVGLGVLGRLAAFFDVPEIAQEAIDPAGRVVGTVGNAQGLPRLDAEDLASLRAGRTKVREGLLRCPLMRGADLRAVVSLRAAPGRVWEPEAIALVEEVAARLCAYAERVEAEEAKRQSRWSSALLDAQMNASIDGIIIVDPEHRRVLQNGRMAEVWGLPADVIDDADDDRQFALVCDAVRNPDAFTAAFAQVVAHPETVYRDEVELKNGTVLDRYSGPATGADGTVLGRIWTFRDVTERVRAEAALREAHDSLEDRVEARTRDLAAATHEAERANAAKSEFLSRMSHELRTPLNAVLGFGQILERQNLDALQKESVHYILKGGRHLLGLINEVLDISRVETGHCELSIEPVPLADVLTESFAMVRTQAAERDVQLVTMLDDEALHVVADRQRLKQVLINLLSNAVKYNRPGGTVTARVSAEDGRLRLAVEDTGRGIPAEGIAKLFTPFERLEASATSIEGTGLGLFLTQKLVVTMGGSLTVASVVGEGSTFAIELELARSPAEALLLVQGGASEPVPVDAEGRAYSVLLVDDNPANVRLLETVLARRPEITLSTASRGLEGFEQARRDEPDLILLDLTLPDVSGTEVLTRLKRSGATRHIPVIVVSADAGEDRVHHSLKAGACAFLTKPLDVERFLEALDDALGIPAAKRAA